MVISTFPIQAKPIRNYTEGKLRERIRRLEVKTEEYLEELEVADRGYDSMQDVGVGMEAGNLLKAFA
jgi:hypothetical protein